jgi:hypothetical protein
MATISKFNRTSGDPIQTQEQLTEEVKTEETKQEIPKATYTINPPRFQPKPRMSPEDEYKDILRQIDIAKANNQASLVIKYDLQDLAWQKLSQAGYKVERRVLDKSVQDSEFGTEKDPNKIEFEINLREFNTAYFK